VTRPREFRQHRFAPAPGSCEILLVRHGESMPMTEGQSFALVDGHGDPHLHTDGVAQAEAVAERLTSTSERIAAIYVTKLTRTQQTAAPLARRLGLEPVVDPDLHEVFLGDWEGGEFRRRIADGDPIAQRMYSEQRWDVIPNAEPAAVFETRVRRGLERIAAAHPDELVVVVVHGGVIGQAMNIASGATGFTFNGAANASITHLVLEPTRWVVRCYNDTGHLWPTFSGEPGAITGAPVFSV
jgi:2,3-bisphosphoglycerate-dependent phosphoglycerate mutase